jgi:hypothetical protein
MNKPFFAAHNRHAPSCGNPPDVESPDISFKSYFENIYGEQWVCWQDDQGIHVAGGDLGWEKVTTYKVEHLLEADIAFPYVLNNEECLWLGACFTTLLYRNGDTSRPRTIAFKPGFDAWSASSLVWLVESGFIRREVMESTCAALGIAAEPKVIRMRARAHRGKQP